MFDSFLCLYDDRNSGENNKWTFSFFPNAFLIPNSWLFADLYQYGRLSLHVPTADHPSVVVGHRVRSSNLQLHQEIHVVHFHILLYITLLSV